MGTDVPTTTSPGLLLARDVSSAETRGIPSCHLTQARVAYYGTGQVPDRQFRAHGHDDDRLNARPVAGHYQG